MGKVIVEKIEGQKNGMVFIMTKDGHPILVRWKWPFGDFVDFIKKDKYLRFFDAAFITDWDVAEGRYVSNSLGWTNMILDSSEIKWVIPVE